MLNQHNPPMFLRLEAQRVEKHIIVLSQLAVFSMMTTPGKTTNTLINFLKLKTDIPRYISV